MTSILAAEPTLHVFSGIAAFDAAQRMAKALSSSTLVPRDYQGPNGLANCLIALEISARMGISPMVVMQNMVPIHGRPTWSSKFLIATVNASGRFSPLRFVFDNETKPTSCYAVATDNKTNEELKGETITLEIARAEGWMDRNGSKWKTMPGQMFRYRSAAWWVNVYCPEISLGLITQEEAYDDIQAVNVQEAVKPTATIATSQDFTPPAITAAAAPVATLTEQQQRQIDTALDRQLTPVGRAAFTVDACGAFGVDAFAEIPAEQHTALMQSIGNAGYRERWNRGCGHADGEPVLTAEQIADLTPDAAEPAPVQPAASTPRAKPAARAAAPAPEATAQPEPEPKEGDDQGDDEALQAELI